MVQWIPRDSSSDGSEPEQGANFAAVQTPSWAQPEQATQTHPQERVATRAAAASAVVVAEEQATQTPGTSTAETGTLTIGISAATATDAAQQAQADLSTTATVGDFFMYQIGALHFETMLLAGPELAGCMHAGRHMRMQAGTNRNSTTCNRALKKLKAGIWISASAGRALFHRCPLGTAQPAVY